MHWLDWAIVAAYLIYIVYDGLRLTKKSNEIEGYFLASRSLPWWAVGLSVMATQLSAITLVGTTGQAYSDGMRFIQFYFGLPFAMVILCVTAVPFFYRAKVFTAYEYLERRFDAKTRGLTSFFFLISRGLSCGVIVAAPSVVLSLVLGWNEVTTILVMGLTTTIYTMFGGVQAVTWTDVKQMVVIFAGMGVILFVIISQFPAGVSISEAMQLAGAAGRMKTVDTKFDLNETYTLWSGLIGGLFLMLSYFGCDQSQVQRFLTAKSVSEGRTSLLMSAFVKIPMQFLILFIGVMVFVFYQFTQPPMIFKADDRAKVEQRAEYQQLNAEYSQAYAARQQAALDFSNQQNTEAAKQNFTAANDRMNGIRKRVGDLVKSVTGKAFNDVNYVFPTFVTTYAPAGVIGLIIAAIFAAAMSSISAELASLSTATVIDFYRRFFKTEAPDSHYLNVSKIATGLWGIFACVVALYAGRLGSLIEVVNKFGSYFYGSLLGVFVLAIGTKRATGNGAFFGLLAGIATVATVGNLTKISFLWYNVVGCVVVVIVGMVLSLIIPQQTSGKN
ncbi:MAG TPA: sodium:solute symporter [Blastocatellia bacterium]|nr:sodium:solute symporter [Blastocatellia bacterium]HMX27574.1 sodium:solute symporter [Blastocatellia bacterium]HMZ21078.1 sodium:solute symporter [Blastocatellia bacterium]HNG33858.1 sodium:solute symporter [Blastocatellia bacterium]